MTPTQVLTNVRDQLAETTAAFWADAEIYRYMWNAEQEIALQYRCAQYQTAATTTTYTSMYTAPESMYSIERMTYRNVKLKKIDLTDYDSLSRTGYGASATVGTPVYYYTYKNQYGLYPVPNASYTVNIWGTVIPTLATGASSVFVVETCFHPCIQDYCLYRCWLKDQDDRRSEFFKKQWETGLQRSYTWWDSHKQSDMYSVVRDEDNYPESELGII